MSSYLLMIIFYTIALLLWDKTTNYSHEKDLLKFFKTLNTYSSHVIMSSDKFDSIKEHSQFSKKNIKWE